jgi:membrane fusion protein (multidrug efflux system)
MRILAVALFAAFGVTGCGDQGASSASPAASSSAAAPAGLTAGTSAAGEPNDVLSVLTVEHEVDVRAQREGTVLQVAAEEGRHVRSGDVLGKLDDRQLQIELEKARADLLVAQNNVKYKEAENQAKEANLKRQQLMRAAGLNSDADLEQAQFEAKATEYDADSYHALVKSNQAQIHSLQIELEQTEFRAPFSGVVVRRYIREGQLVAKDDPGFRVSQLAPLQVHFQVPESAAGRPQVGASVSLAMPADPSHSYSARIVKVSPTVDPSSDSYDVTAQLSGDNLSGLSPGMAVRISWAAKSAAAAKP